MKPEQFWKENYVYHRRQGDKGSVRSNVALFKKILSKTEGVETIIEFGAGMGLNLEAIGKLNPSIQATGIEINEIASKRIPADYVLNMNLLDYNYMEHGQAELVFTKGVCIHLPPEDINKAYKVLYDSSSKYIMMAEYYSPNRVEIDYRGESGKLWKADFYGEMMALYPNLELVDSGFVGYWDDFPQDSINWWLWRK